MDEVLRVTAGERDGDETGREWEVDYVLFESVDDDTGLTTFDLYTDDGLGNGPRICRFDNLTVARSLMLRLGDVVVRVTDEDPNNTFRGDFSGFAENH